MIRGVKLVHHMMYEQADREFAAAAAADPSCALAHWGRAMTLIHPVWPDSPSAADLERGAAFVERGLASPPRTDRERAYLETLGRFYRADASMPYSRRLQELDTAWAQLARAYPDDMDAQAFAALFHLAPVRFLPKDKSSRAQIEAAGQLETVLSRIPDHPGAQHYKIHAYDFPLLADRALEVCSTYGAIAPDVPHALHMPTHIYTRRGLWDKSIEFNLLSASAARKIDVAAGALSGHLPHALDYLAYAYLQRGQYSNADGVRRELAACTGPYAPTQHMQMAFALAAVPARFALERQAWLEAAELPLHQPAAFPWGRAFINCDSITHFARAIGSARSGRLDAVRTELVALERIHAQLSDSNRTSYWTAQAETQLLAARAWLAAVEGQLELGIELMRRAAALEATADKEAVTPGEVLPAGDLLADMLLEGNRPAEALAAYAAVLEVSPNRLYTLYGAGVAAEQAGDMERAHRYFTQLAEVARESDAGVERVGYARAFLERESGSGVSGN